MNTRLTTSQDLSALSRMGGYKWGKNKDLEPSPYVYLLWYDLSLGNQPYEKAKGIPMCFFRRKLETLDWCRNIF